MKKYFLWAAIFIVCLLLTIWNVYCALVALVLIAFFLCDYHTSPKKEESKSQKILTLFEQKVTIPYSSEKIEEELKHYSLRRLEYLRNGMQNKISTLRKCNTFTLKEEDRIDTEIKEYEKVLQIVEKYIQN